MYERERLMALAVAEKASQLCLNVRQQLVSEETLTKKDRSPVTVADYGVQALVCQALNETFPNDLIIGEEELPAAESSLNDDFIDRMLPYLQTVRPKVTKSEAVAAIRRADAPGGEKGRFWVLDPIDGTKGFLRGDQYAVALALVEDGQVVLGVLGCPNLPMSQKTKDGDTGCLMWAVRGRGAYCCALDGTKQYAIQVASTKQPKETVFCESYESGHSSHDHSAQIRQQLEVVPEVIRMDSQCKYGLVARGEAGVYLRLPTRKGYREKLWDHAAGAILVTEAGGSVTDLWGRDLDFGAGRTFAPGIGVVVSNGLLHQPVRQTAWNVLGLQGSAHPADQPD